MKSFRTNSIAALCCALIGAVLIATAAAQTANDIQLASRFAEENLYQTFENHPCRRNCRQGQPMTCHYKLVLHLHRRLGPECQRCIYDESACAAERCLYGDGVPTPVMAVNGYVPGPPIELCVGDYVIAEVLNQLNETMTMHWHGMRMSQSPEMDGAPFVTQYPLQPASIFRYRFEADRSGTVWYHSHQGWQRALGIMGSFIIRESRAPNQHASLYDFDLIEHTMMVGDVIYNNDFNRITNILINGRGRNHLDSSLPDNNPRYRYEQLAVRYGYRYRMRVISNGVFNCPLEFSIENHRMLIISTDGHDIVPVWTDTFFMSSAERFDFILDASQPEDNYWIRLRGYHNCSTENLYQGAVLHYRGAPEQVPFTRINVPPTSPNGGRITRVNALAEFNLDENAPAARPSMTTDIPMYKLQSVEPLRWPASQRFQTFYSSFGVRVETNGDFNFQIDDITYSTTMLSMLQARHLFRDEEEFCNRTQLRAAGRDCVNTNCQCTNVIHLPAFAYIEMVVVNFMERTHPLHTHGYFFRVVGQGVIGNVADLRRIEEIDRMGGLERSSPTFASVQKDTVQIPAMGYVIIRFYSDNPGFWLYHCHVELHAILGMVAVLKVGTNDQIVELPPNVQSRGGMR